MVDVGVGEVARVEQALPVGASRALRTPKQSWRREVERSGRSRGGRIGIALEIQATTACGTQQPMFHGVVGIGTRDAAGILFADSPERSRHD